MSARQRLSRASFSFCSDAASCFLIPSSCQSVSLAFGPATSVAFGTITSAGSGRLCFASSAHVVVARVHIHPHVVHMQYCQYRLRQKRGIPRIPVFAAIAIFCKIPVQSLAVPGVLPTFSGYVMLSISYRRCSGIDTRCGCDSFYQY